MKYNQTYIINLLNAMPLADIADLNFSVTVTEIMQKRTLEYRQSPAFKASLRPKGSTNVRVTPNNPHPSLPYVKAPISKKKTPAAKKVAARSMTIAEREKLTAQWAKSNIRPFQLVKMKDTRDGHGLRLILSVDSGGFTCRRYQRIDANAIGRYRVGTVITVNEAGTNQYYVQMADTTTHQLGKVVAVLNRKGMELIPTPITL